MSKEGYFEIAFMIILTNPKRSESEFIARSLCAVILPRFDDFARDYKKAGNFKDCPSFAYALAKAYKVDIKTIDTFLDKLAEFKNERDYIACMTCAKPLLG